MMSSIREIPTRLSILTRAADELEQVRAALGLEKDNLYLFRHSWGGILAMEYALKYQQNLKGLIISNMSSSEFGLTGSLKDWDISGRLKQNLIFKFLC